MKMEVRLSFQAVPRVASTHAMKLFCVCLFLSLQAGTSTMLPASREIDNLKSGRWLQSGSSYCVAVSNADPTKLQKALDWACGSGSTLGNVDCSPIQRGGSCYQPDSLTNHASYAFDLYYVKMQGAAQACNFKGLATTTQTNPSSGTCNYPSTTSSSLTPTPPSVTTPSTPAPMSSNFTYGTPTSTSNTSSGGMGRLLSLHRVKVFASAVVVMLLSCTL